MNSKISYGFENSLIQNENNLKNTFENSKNNSDSLVIKLIDISGIEDNGKTGKIYAVSLDIISQTDIQIINIKSKNKEDFIYNVDFPIKLNKEIKSNITFYLRTSSEENSKINLEIELVEFQELPWKNLQTYVIIIPPRNQCRCSQPALISLSMNYIYGTNQTIRLECSNSSPNPISVPIGVPLTFNATVNCISPLLVRCTKKIQVKVEKRASTGWIFLGTFDNTTNPLSVPITLPSNGQYRVTVTALCGQSKCISCVFILNANLSCGECLGWGETKLLDGQNNFLTILPNGGGIPAIESGRNYFISTRYFCASAGYTCPVTYRWTIYPSSGCGSPIYGTSTVNSQDLLIIPFNPICGALYTITISAQCGNTRCNQEFTTTIKIRPKCACEGIISIRNTVTFSDPSGNQIEKTIRCGMISEILGPFPRNGNITINYDIPCDAQCQKQFSWRVKDPSGNVITTNPVNYSGGNAPASFTFPGNSIGEYIVEVSSQCGTEVCRICQFKVRINEMPCEFIDLGPNEESEICNSNGTTLILNGFTGSPSNIRWYRTTHPTENPASLSSNMIQIAGNPVSGSTYNTGNLFSNGCSNTIYRYQCITTNPACTSDIKTVVVRPRITNINLTASRYEICSGMEEITLNASTSSSLQTDCGCLIKWYKISGDSRTQIGEGYRILIDRNSLIVNCPDIMKEFTYEATFCEGKCNQISKQINIKVYSNPIAGLITADRDTICYLDATTLHADEFCGGTIQWQLSTNPTGPFVDMDGATHKNQNTNKLPVTTYYRAKISNGPCGEIYSDVKEIVVQQPFNISVITAPNSCSFLCPDMELQAVVSGPMLDDNTYFEWYYNGVLVPDSRNLEFLRVSQSGNYNIKIFNNVREDFNAECDTIISQSKQVRNLEFIFEGGECVCKGTKTRFDVILLMNPCHDMYCKWSINGIPVSGTNFTGNSTFENFDVVDGDIIKVEVIAPDFCYFEKSITVRECSNCP
ncbi:MAG TPA: hypothetical protein PLG90_10280 [Ignavibacteria bacterium]|nr:hypothetical protein [Ignavibacteria bacterium]